MRYVKNVVLYVRMVLKGMLFIGFSIQIVLGVCWICGNFGQVQDFGAPESALYRGILWLVGENPMVLYSLQLLIAFFAGFLFLQKLWPAGIVFALWRGLALLTFPFALQCHLALQPHSLMGSAFLLLLLAVLQIRRKQMAGPMLAAFGCAAIFAGLSGAVDSDRRESAGYSIEGALASRFAWPTLWNDFDGYGAALQIVPKSVVWEASFSPDNMKLFQENLESQVGTETARNYYLQMAKAGWQYHGPMVIRQIGWDVLGYTVTPIIFPLQMAGEAYDSYSGRNYEIMRENTPILTRDYVDYGCWWFQWMLLISACLALCMGISQSGAENPVQQKNLWRKWVLPIGICCVLSGLLVLLLTMRGAGKMDYRQTIAINELWLIGSLLLLGKGGLREPAVGKEAEGQKGL